MALSKNQIALLQEIQDNGGTAQYIPAAPSKKVTVNKGRKSQALNPSVTVSLINSGHLKKENDPSPMLNGGVFNLTLTETGKNAIGKTGDALQFLKEDSF